MIDGTRSSNVWSSVALVEVRVMMAVTMYIFETLFVLHGVRGDCSGFARCWGFCSWWFLVDNVEMTEIDGEHAC